MKKYKKRLVLVLLLLVVQAYGFAQSDFKNGIFIEVGGAGYYGSVNYEYQFAHGLTARVGVCYLYSTLVVPVTFGKIFGEKKHHFEITTGFTYALNGNTSNTSVTKSETTIAITGFIGYRFQVPEKRFFFKGGFAPLWDVYYTSMNNESRSEIFPWAGGSAGFRF